MKDIYNPPPAAIPWEPPPTAPIRWTWGDLAWLGVLTLILLGVAGLAARIEPALWPIVLVGGTFVVLESWFSAMTFLHRHPEDAHQSGRWRIMLAALAPWALCLGLALALMLGLFSLSDRTN